MTDATDGQPSPDFDSPDALPGSGGGDSSNYGSSLPQPVESSDFWSDRYKMDHKQRGVAVIINNKTFDEHTGMGVRKGTDIDASKMFSLFETLGFEEIVLKNDLSVKAMKNLLKSAAKQDYSDKDCFACVILSHGDEGYVYGVDDRVEIDELVAPFKGNKCKSLAGKPKLFFIQACRGTALDAGVDSHDGESGEPVDIRRIPTEADFLMAYSVTPGFYSWRNSTRGSWFIQAVSDVINQHWNQLDLLSMMTRVNKKVAYDFISNSSNPGMSQKKQIPCITSMLTKDVFFK